MRTNASDAFEHFNVSQSIGKSKRKLMKFFGEPMTFRTENPNIEKLKKMKNMKKKTNKCNAFVSNKMNKLLN